MKRHAPCDQASGDGHHGPGLVLEPLSTAFSYIAMVAWLVTFIAFLRTLGRSGQSR